MNEHICTYFTDWESEHLMHYGAKGMKWGVRKYQNADGSLTALGREHYGVGDGGNKRLARLYNRQVKKLKKLESRADIETQKANIGKYNKRAKIAAGVGVGAAGVAAGAYGLNSHLRKIAKAAMDAKYAEAEAGLSSADKAVRKIWKSDTQAYDKFGNWTGKGYTDETIRKTREFRDKVVANDDRLVGEAKAIKDKFNRGSQIRKAVTYGAAAVSAVSFGFAAYNKVQAHMAKTRISEVGHAKAVANARAQVQKMEKMFANTPYSELIKKQNKKT